MLTSLGPLRVSKTTAVLQNRFDLDDDEDEKKKEKNRNSLEIGI